MWTARKNYPLKKKIWTSGWKFLAGWICGKCIRWVVTLHNLWTPQCKGKCDTHTLTHRASPLYSPSASIRAVSHAVSWQCPAFSSHLQLTQKLDDWILCCVSMVKRQMSFLLIRSVKFTSPHGNVQREENKQETSLFTSSQIAFLVL